MKVSVIISCSILFLIIFICMVLFCVKWYKLNKFANSAYLSNCYTGGGEIEWGERDVAYKFTHPRSKVLEFGGGAGSVSQVIQNILLDPSKHVVIQPNDNSEMFGGFKQITKNKKSCNCKYTIIDHILEKGEGPQVKALIGGYDFDLIVADCEDCLLGEYFKNPDLFKGVRMIQVERDDINNSYNKLFNILGMRKIHTGLHISRKLRVEVWVR